MLVLKDFSELLESVEQNDEFTELGSEGTPRRGIESPFPNFPQNLNRIELDNLVSNFPQTLNRVELDTGFGGFAVSPNPKP